MTKFPITLTPAAVQMAQKALQDNQEEGEYLRISVNGGGCAGLKYGLNFVSTVDSLDWITQVEGLKVVADIFTATQIEGTTIDYQETLQGAGFKFENPAARRTCGCGSSFSG
jgi:iron-sulfur cluster assembly protein